LASGKPYNFSVGASDCDCKRKNISYSLALAAGNRAHAARQDYEPEQRGREFPVENGLNQDGPNAKFRHRRQHMNAHCNDTQTRAIFLRVVSQFCFLLALLSPAPMRMRVRPKKGAFDITQLRSP